MTPPTVLALDLEGTLISNAYSQIPRPGLAAFLEACFALAPRIVMFTTVPEPTFRAIARSLVSAGMAPDWFAHAEYVRWQGSKKDLDAIPAASHAEVRIVDDDPERFAIAGQLGSWLTIDYFGPPYRDDDAGLAAILPALRAEFGTDANAPRRPAT
jgi:hypothetical protein